MSLLIAFFLVMLGMFPGIIIFRRSVVPYAISVVAILAAWWVVYVSTPSLVWPFGNIVLLVLPIIAWFVTALVVSNSGERGGKFPLGLACGMVVLIIGRSCVSSSVFQSDKYAGLIGEVEKREWTKDVQPKDPKHVRLVPYELARYLATKQLGEVGGAVGSQFEIGKLTLQLVKNELWYVAPLDFKGFSVWTSAEAAPGYVMVHGEDPKCQVIVKADRKFHYTPGAFFSQNLERHLWQKYMLRFAMTDFCFELDDQGNPWWVVCAYLPTIGFWGHKAEGVIVVDPSTGEDKFYPIGETPEWIDRVVPAAIVEDNVNDRGEYAGGWWNSFWGHKNLSEAEPATLIYGADGRAQWATGLTSINANDTSLIGLVYTDARTGKSVEYHAVGGTEAAVLELVNNKVSYRKLHGSSPVLYNVYGQMTSIVPLLGESHSFQGVALVDVANMQVVVGDDVNDAFRQYQKVVMLGSGQTLAPDKAHNLKSLFGVVDRFTSEAIGNETMYYVHLRDQPRLFSGESDLSPKLRMTRVGDEVMIGYIESGESVVPMTTFDLPSLPLVSSKNEAELRDRVTTRVEAERARSETKSIRGEVQNLTDDELRELMKHKQKQK